MILPNAGIKEWIKLKKEKILQWFKFMFTSKFERIITKLLIPQLAPYIFYRVIEKRLLFKNKRENKVITAW